MQDYMKIWVMLGQDDILLFKFYNKATKKMPPTTLNSFGFDEHDAQKIEVGTRDIAYIQMLLHTHYVTALFLDCEVIIEMCQDNSRKEILFERQFYYA